MTQHIQKKSELQQFIETYQRPLNDYAYGNLKKSDFWISVKMAISSNETLMKAVKTEQGRISLVNSLKYAIKTGLSLNPMEGKACLIGYEDKNGNIHISYQIMKNGYIEMAMESGIIDDCIGTTVREGDEFDLIQSGQSDSYTLKKARKNRGKIDGYLAAIKFKDGRIRCEYITHEEAMEHKNKYAKGLTWPDGKLKQDHAWNKSEEGMCIKTGLKKLLTSLKICKRLDDAVEADNQNENIPERDITPGVSADDVSEKLDQPRTEKPVIPETETEQEPEKGAMF